MKVIILNTFDVVGGAAKAAYRLHKGLSRAGLNSKYLVASKRSDNTDIITCYNFFDRWFFKIRSKLDKLPLCLYPQREKVIFSPAIVPSRISKILHHMNPDIVHLHWIAGGFIRIEQIAKITKPIVWTLHDMWAFTGGCHYDQDCGKYMNSCGQCPILRSEKRDDLSRLNFSRKSNAFKDLNLIIVTPSKWLAECARKSSILKDKRILVIPNGIDTEKFRPVDKKAARKHLGLPHDKKLILFGAFKATSDQRKGYKKLAETLNLLKEERKLNMKSVVFGGSKNGKFSNPNSDPIHIGHVEDDARLSLLYSSADVLIAPSIQENLSNVVLESLSCGTPVVAFEVGGMPDMIDHKENGYLAKPFDVHDLAEGIRWVLADEPRHQLLRTHARNKIESEFTIELSAKKYIDLYRETLQ
ncbi:MAG: glycosyltransferase family 4 protein [Candidatus Omnitrophota bacterium]